MICLENVDKVLIENKKYWLKPTVITPTQRIQEYFSSSFCLHIQKNIVNKTPHFNKIIILYPKRFSNMDFKLIAIRALNGCHKDFRKNLNEDYFYKIYKRYRLENISGLETVSDDIENVTILPSIAEDLFQLKTKDGRLLDLNISAIVGKNGSGKSTISELFFATLYVFSVRSGLLKPDETTLESEKGELKSALVNLMQNNSDHKLYERIMRVLKSDRTPTFEATRNMFRLYEDITKKDFDTKIAYKKRIKVIEQEIDEIVRLCNGLKSEIIFSLSKTVLSLKVSDIYPTGFYIKVISSKGEDDPLIIAQVRDLKIEKLLDIEKFLPDLFFYTVAINYSNYSLNSDIIGKWIQWLFHKNDGYRSPVVINPMRTRGEFKIENENRFAKYRLLSNLISSSKSSSKINNKFFLNQTQNVKNIRFTLNEKKINEYTIDDTGVSLKGNEIEVAIVEGLYESFFPEGSQLSIRAGAGEQIFKLISNYVIQKVKRICKNYDGFEYPSTITMITPLITKLKMEDSHITFKLKQAIYFIIHNVFPNTNHTFFGDHNEVVHEIEFSPIQLFEWMGQPEDGEIINHIPPSIFTIDFELESMSGETSLFNRLSSGEQQFIHVIQSVLYHIINLQSVSTTTDRIAYRALNIIFDEVELYFHPDMQRKFILNLRNAIKNLYLKGEGGFVAVNILFLTHSPFILSDIPAENVLRLTTDEDNKAIAKDVDTETFAANIHDLLADNFFLDDTLIGAFADDKIVKFIENVKNNGVGPLDDNFVKLIGDQYLKTGLENFIENIRNDKN